MIVSKLADICKKMRYKDTEPAFIYGVTSYANRKADEAPVWMVVVPVISDVMTPDKYNAPVFRVPMFFYAVSEHEQEGLYYDAIINLLKPLQAAFLIHLENQVDSLGRKLFEIIGPVRTTHLHQVPNADAILTGIEFVFDVRYSTYAGLCDTLADFVPEGEGEGEGEL